jgi:cell division protein FtsB
LLREQRHLIHNRKIERGELKLRITQLEHEKSVLRKENEKLKATKEKKKEKVDFKKNFFDRL